MLSRIGLSWKAAGAVGAVATAAYSFVRHREQRSAEFLDKYWWNSAALIVADEDSQMDASHLHHDKNPPFVGMHGFRHDERFRRDASSSLERMYDKDKLHGAYCADELMCQALVEAHARAGVDTVVFLAKPWPWSDERRGLTSARKLHGAYSRAVDAVRARAASSTELALPECVLVDSVSVDSLRESHPELWIDPVDHASATAMVEASKPKKTALVDAHDTGLRKVDRKISALMQGPSASGGLYYIKPFDWWLTPSTKARATREAEALAEQTQQDGVDNLIFGCDHSNSRGPNAAREYRDALRRRGAPADRQQRLYVVKEGKFGDGIRGHGRDYFAKSTTGLKSYDEETNTFRAWSQQSIDEYEAQFRKEYPGAL